MLLSVHSRLVLLGMAAKAEGHLTTLRLVRDFQSALGFDEAELAAVKFVTTEGQITWTPGVEPKEIEVGAELKKAVAGWFKPEDDAGTLKIEILPLYEQFLSD